LDAQNVEAHKRLALIYSAAAEDNLRNEELGLVHAETALKLSKKDEAEVFEVLAIAHAAKGDFESALTSIQHALFLTRALRKDEKRIMEKVQLFASGRSFQTTFERAVR
jgi:hypothetical protein